jgi:hypothetical protein
MENFNGRREAVVKSGSNLEAKIPSESSEKNSPNGIQIFKAWTRRIQFNSTDLKKFITAIMYYSVPKLHIHLLYVTLGMAFKI